MVKQMAVVAAFVAGVVAGSAGTVGGQSVAVSITGERIIHEVEGGPITFQFTDGAGLEFSSLEDAKARIAERFADVERARFMHIAQYLAKFPQANNASQWQKTTTVDPSNVNLVRTQ